MLVNPVPRALWKFGGCIDIPDEGNQSYKSGAVGTSTSGGGWCGHKAEDITGELYIYILRTRLRSKDLCKARLRYLVSSSCCVEVQVDCFFIAISLIFG